jgi:hypothetical protein
MATAATGGVTWAALNLGEKQDALLAARFYDLDRRILFIGQQPWYSKDCHNKLEVDGGIQCMYSFLDEAPVN